MARRLLVGTALACFGAALVNPTFGDDRASTSKKGSLLIYPKVELRWAFSPEANTFFLTQDTVLTITNDFPEDVDVQYYFINGDPQLDPVFTGSPPILVERGHPGWNNVDCQNPLTGDQSVYWSAFTGLPAGCQPFTALDPGSPPGRPDPDGGSDRVLRGFVMAWAVNDAGEEIRWNHLSGTATLINYAQAAAWEYNAYAYRALTTAAQGSPSDATPGELSMDGIEYDLNYDELILDFFAEGSFAFSSAAAGVTVINITDLTLAIVNVDLQQGGFPRSTKAVADIWNSNEVRFSGTERCITCWDQTLLSLFTFFGPGNHFLLANLQSDKGKARIDGDASTICPGSTAEALVGAEAKFLFFVNTGGAAAAGSTLVGQGEDDTARILYDIIEPPDEAEQGGDLSVGQQGGLEVGSSLVKPVRK
jgi:hypothetical protein